MLSAPDRPTSRLTRRAVAAVRPGLAARRTAETRSESSERAYFAALNTAFVSAMLAAHPELAPVYHNALGEALDHKNEVYA
jgi:hypothetical protein